MPPDTFNLPSVPEYRGRFAPTPSGPLHLGSLATALASFLCARAVGGRWFLRFDDLDTPRVAPGAVDTILRQLDAHALHWDQSPRFQSDHLATYVEVLDSLRLDGATYACACTRAELKVICRPGTDEPIYPGRCRDRLIPETEAALRVRIPESSLCITDRWLGPMARQFGEDLGDFVLRRRDGLIAYQLASAIDERDMGITEVIRGKDLLASSFRQAYLLQRLGYPLPRFGHLPLVLDSAGHKLSKQNHASAVAVPTAGANLKAALSFLGQESPEVDTPAEIIAWAVAHWHPDRVPVEP